MTRNTSLQKMRRNTVRGSRWPGDVPEDSDYNDSVSGDSDSGDWDSESAYDSSERESILSGDVQVMAGERSSFPGEDAQDEEGEGDRTGQARYVRPSSCKCAPLNSLHTQGRISRSQTSNIASFRGKLPSSEVPMQSIDSRSSENLRTRSRDVGDKE